ncbi:cellulose biosynthesis cyclic di-GMP-binding regulatory protein BcsB [Tumebacillus sp. ITR2]|uniref:Cellulose biosynthesis cyclic di-GMP-binding regulatory protein BcsB n=1 Tax=Tumebacillus amylolyticus TaxID=2801339 RepID=A0ABS1J477_9BACL|nr:cellulose biosynthesis cyclic di-GMP-binding regulatory protein BcsB [Tumebacillus amylolyticus]MBL0385077.1 cellulose biosynthesis cyclic di-GMP-binding regulatory protein BcsB [Tumebacillus amylolyticus]
MNKRWWQRWLLKTAALLTALSLVSPAGAAPPAKTSAVPQPTAEGLQNTFITSSNVTLTPMSSRFEYFLQVSPRWTVRSADFTIHFRHSATLVKELSSVSLLVDGVPYHTIWLGPENETNGVLSAHIPSGALTPGFHQFSVASNMRSHRELCDDLSDPANWLVLENTSLIHLDYANHNDTPNLQMFPVPFLSESGAGPWNVNIVVPDLASDRELSVAYRLVTVLAKLQSLNASSARVLKLSDWTPDTDPRNLIVVGQVEKLPADWQKHFSDLLSTGRDVGLLREVTSTESGKRAVLFVSGHTERGVEIAAESLSYPNFRKQLSGATAQVSEEVLTAAQELQKKERDALALATQEGRVTMKQLSYKEVTLSNVQTSSASYTFNTPPMWQYTKGAGVKLHLKYSSLLDDKRSAVIATVNGSPQVSQKLSAATAEGLDLFVPFPEDLRVGEEVRVNVQAEMYLETNSCMDDNNPSGMRRYLSIDPDQSEFILPHMNKETAALANFPGAFLSENSSLEQTTAVLPSKPTESEMIALAQVVAGASNWVERDGLEVVRHHSDANLRDKVWVIDTAGDNEFLQQMAENRELAIRSTPSGLQSDTVPLVNTTQTNGGAIQQVFRPNGGTALVVAAPTPDMLLETATVLADRTEIRDADTQGAALRTSDRQTVLMTIDTQPYLSLPQRVANRVAETYGYLRSSEGQLVIFGSAFGLTVLVILWFIWKLIWRPKLETKGKWKRRKKKPKPPKNTPPPPTPKTESPTAPTYDLPDLLPPKDPEDPANWPSRKNRNKK